MRKHLVTSVSSLACLVAAIALPAGGAQARTLDLDEIAMPGIDGDALASVEQGSDLTDIATVAGAMPGRGGNGPLLILSDGGFDLARFAAQDGDAYGPAEPEPTAVETPVGIDGQPEINPYFDADGDVVLKRWADHVPHAYATHKNFGAQFSTITTEMALFALYFSAQSGKKLFRETDSFSFHDEGWFGKDTGSLGSDKMLHAFDTYLIAEILHMRLHETTNASQGDVWVAAALASALMAANELSDGIEPDTGYSLNDVAMNTAGALFSVLRNTVPGLRDKVAFKLEIVPNDDIYSYRGRKHYEQQRYMFSIKGRGFEGLKDTPFRFLDLQLGYYASNFLKSDIDAGEEPRRHLFVGVGLNVGEILFGRNKTGFSRHADRVLDYLQLPYTSVRLDAHGDVKYGRY
ncbi:DUF2279 domain-containing protein [Croceicoccus gelatinilyticus]|uniref:DUF2279 domain-containing protein n=1 Tax=Croceicoccus gelatinilyticus TaxID=2835536 RepID=UPI001BD0CD0B|nr:DUF2279 domain-containing protein [Croceicoccus gelatinilyticus]MBS7671182.1 DUF2279 domain-containing protein [Croceicoccus gelatinilyticus]